MWYFCFDIRANEYLFHKKFAEQMIWLGSWKCLHQSRCTTWPTPCWTTRSPCRRRALTTSVTTSPPSATPWPQTLESSILGSARLWKSFTCHRDSKARALQKLNHIKHLICYDMVFLCIWIFEMILLWITLKKTGWM